MEQPDFLFNRELSLEELDFWATFFDNIPIHYNCYFQSVINNYSNRIVANNFVENYNLSQSYTKIKDCETIEQMFEIVKELNWLDVAQEKFTKIINWYERIFPNTKPINLFLFSIYAGQIQQWDLNICKIGISLSNKKEKDIALKTYVPQLAMIVDLMAGRINDFFPELKLNPVEISGKTIITDIVDGSQYLIVLKDDKNNSTSINNRTSYIVERWSVDTKNGNLNSKSLDFAFNFHKNSITTQNTYAPLEFQQETLLKLVQNNYLENTLSSNEKTIKIKKV